ncbi:MAG: hypothetical protein IKK30_06510 [Clostridia bacterium]|nr:hypothetical protein [Clostridia bacterium]
MSVQIDGHNLLPFLKNIIIIILRTDLEKIKQLYLIFVNKKAPEGAFLINFDYNPVVAIEITFVINITVCAATHKYVNMGPTNQSKERTHIGQKLICQ